MRPSSLEWTFVYPVLLTDGPLTWRYPEEERLELRGLPRISRADVARFILTEVECSGFARKAVALTEFLKR